MNVRTVHVKMAQTVSTKELDINASVKPGLRAKIVKMMSMNVIAFLALMEELVKIM